MLLSPEQKDNLRLGWRNCPACEKKMIMAEFIREYGSDPGWDEWLMFLGRRLNSFCYGKSLGIPEPEDFSV